MSTGSKRRRKIPNYREMAAGTRRKVTYTNNSTQTSPEIRKDNQIIVLLKRMPNRRLFSKLKKMKDNVVENCEAGRNTIQDQDANGGPQPSCSGTNKLKDKIEVNISDKGQEDLICPNANIESLMTASKRPDVLSGLPTSTEHLDNMPIDIPNNINVKIERERQSTSLQPIHTKPSPKCSKNMNIECNRIPIMLDGSENNSESLQSLSPITEKSKRTESINVSAMILEKSITLNEVFDITDGDIEASASKASNVSITRLEDQDDPDISSYVPSPEKGTFLENCFVEVNNIADIPENLCQIENVPADCHDRNDGGDANQNGAENIYARKRKKRRKKYVTINTKNVYIYSKSFL